MVEAGSTLVIRRADHEYYKEDDISTSAHRAWLEILDLSDPTSPTLTSVNLPEGAGHMDLPIDGTTVLT